MFCSKCGSQIADQAAVCVHCGQSVVGQKQAKQDKASAGWWWLGFLVPLAGLLVFIFCHDSTPNRAKKAGWGALISTILSVVLTVVIYVLYFVFIIWLSMDMMDLSYLFI